MRSQILLRLTVPLVTAGLLIAISQPASAAGVVEHLRHPPPYPGRFLAAGVPVYAAAPDGWECHFGQDIRPLVGGNGCTTPAQRAATEPEPVWVSSATREDIDVVICERGQFDLIQSRHGRGWAPADQVATDRIHTDGRKYVQGCSAFQWS